MKTMTQSVPLVAAFTSESIRWASVAVDHAPGVAGSTAGHASAAVEGLSLPAEARALLRRLLMASWLVLGMEGTNYYKNKGVGTMQ